MHDLANFGNGRRLNGARRQIFEDGPTKRATEEDNVIQAAFPTMKAFSEAVSNMNRTLNFLARCT